MTALVYIEDVALTPDAARWVEAAEGEERQRRLGFYRELRIVPAPVEPRVPRTPTVEHLLRLEAIRRGIGQTSAGRYRNPHERVLSRRLAQEAIEAFVDRWMEHRFDVFARQTWASEGGR